MLNLRKTQTEPTPLDAEIDRLLGKIKEIDPETKEYATVADQITKLYKLKEIDANLDLKYADAELKQTESDATLKLKQEEGAANLKLREAETVVKVQESDRILGLKPETLAVVGGNLAGIVLILGFERVNIVTSKALGFVMKSAR